MKITEKKLLSLTEDEKKITVYRKAYETLIKKVTVISQNIIGNRLVIKYSAKGATGEMVLNDINHQNN